ncbi:MAG: hypothetical protein QXN55_00460 [Candidatus Nitrosotenuis sp.]
MSSKLTWKQLCKLARELADIIPAVIKEVTGNVVPAYHDVHDMLFDRWYATLDPSKDIRQQKPDYSIYNVPDYMAVPAYCFKQWTKGNTLSVIKFFEIIDHTPKSVMDVFAGTGQSTILLAKAFPDSEIIYYNVADDQPEVFRRLCQIFDVKNATATNKLQTTEAVVAFESIEHVIEPCKFITPIIENPETLFYADASSFSQPGIGHFPQYINAADQPIKNKGFKRHFNRHLNSLGFYRHSDPKRFFAKHFFNGRPTIFVRDTFRP